MKLQDSMLAYRCPSCGAQVCSVTGVFALSGDLFKLKCDCGGSELVLMRTGADKLQLTVPCFLCASPHQYVVSRELLTTKDLFTLTCACSDIPICITGTETQVLAAAEEADAMLQTQMDAAGFSDFSDFHPAHEAPPADPADADAVQFAFSALCEEGGILCNCPAGEGDYTYELMTDSVLFYCRGCGCTKMMPLGSEGARETLATCVTMDLRGRLAEE